MFDGLLEDDDRARKRAHFILPVRVGNRDAGRAACDLFGDARDVAQRLRHRASDDRDARNGEKHAHDRHCGEEPRGSRHAGVQLGIDLLGARVVDPRQCVEVLVQGRAHAAVRFVVAPFASFRRAHFRAEPDQLLAKLHELLDALVELGELRGLGAAHMLAPVGNHARDALVGLQQERAVALGGRNVGRHVDAAQFHDHRVDQAVDAFDIHRAHERAFELVGERRVVA